MMTSEEMDKAREDVLDLYHSLIGRLEAVREDASDDEPGKVVRQFCMTMIQVLEIGVEHIYREAEASRVIRVPARSLECALQSIAKNSDEVKRVFAPIEDAARPFLTKQDMRECAILPKGDVVFA